MKHIIQTLIGWLDDMTGHRFYTLCKLAFWCDCQRCEDETWSPDCRADRATL